MLMKQFLHISGDVVKAVMRRKFKSLNAYFGKKIKLPSQEASKRKISKRK